MAGYTPCNVSVANSVYVGTNLTIKMSGGNVSDPKFKLRYKVTGQDKYININGGNFIREKSYSWKVPTSVYNYFLPDENFVQLTIQCITYHPNGVKVGSKTCNVAAIGKDLHPQFPDGAQLRAAPLGSGLDGKGIYIKGISKVRLSCSKTPTTKYRAKITSYVFTGDNIYGNNNTHSYTVNSIASSIIQSTGQKTYAVSAVDSRGYISVALTTSIDVFDYTPPTIESVTVTKREDIRESAGSAEGEFTTGGTMTITVTVVTTHQKIFKNHADQNSLTISLDPMGTISAVEQSQSIVSETESGVVTQTNVYNYNNVPINVRSSISVSINDQVLPKNIITEPIGDITSAQRALNITQYGNGVAIGGMSSVNDSSSNYLFECYYPTQFKEGVHIENSTGEYLTIDHKNMITENSSKKDVRGQMYVAGWGWRKAPVTIRRRIKPSDSETWTTEGWLAIRSDAVTVSNRFSTNGLQETEDGKEGVFLTENGRIYLIGKDNDSNSNSNKAAIIFQNNKSTSATSSIIETSSGKLTFDCNAVTTGNITANGNMYTNGKTGANDGSNGVTIGSNGKIYLTGSGTDNSKGQTCGLAFTYNKGTATTSSIIETSSGTITVKGILKATLDGSSDERMKRDFQNLSKFEEFYDNLNPCCFKMKSDDERYHIGFVAQQVEQSLNNSGLTKNDFGALNITPYEGDIDESSEDCIGRYKDTGIKQGEDSYGLIYNEFIALNTYMIQKLKSENEELKNRVSLLEEKLASTITEIENLKESIKNEA